MPKLRRANFSRDVLGFNSVAFSVCSLQSVVRA